MKKTKLSSGKTQLTAESPSDLYGWDTIRIEPVESDQEGLWLVQQRRPVVPPLETREVFCDERFLPFSPGKIVQNTRPSIILQEDTGNVRVSMRCKELPASEKLVFADYEWDSAQPAYCIHGLPFLTMCHWCHDYFEQKEGKEDG